MPMQKKPNTRSDRDGRDRDRDVIPSHKRQRPMSNEEIVDINDVDFLKRFVTEYGKIIPARITGVTAAQQRQIKKGVRRARNMGLMA